jgi:heterodisulfide reductase subunit D
MVTRISRALQSGYIWPMSESFEQALQDRVGTMLDACTRCGKCVEACPVTEPGGVTADPRTVIDGVIDLLRLGEGHEDGRKWANACVMSGDCVRGCEYGVNPRFLLAVARATMAKAKVPAAEMRKRGVEAFRLVNRDVTHLSKMQLGDTLLERLGQTSQGTGAAPERPDFVFYTGCNVLKTPHIALLALDIMDALGVTYQVMGGPTHCCGVMRLRAGDTETYARVAEAAIDKLSQAKNGQVISWCPSCHVQMTEISMPQIEKMRGSRPFEMTPFMLFLRGRLDDLRHLMRERVEMRVALHKHHGVTGAMDAASEVLRAVPGIELVELHQPAAGLMSNYVGPLDFKQKLIRDELEAARAAQVDALVAVYHPDHRELCAHEAEYPFRILNVLEIVGASMGLRREDRYKELKVKQDADAIAADCADLAARHGLDPATSRKVIEAMLADQPVPLRGHLQRGRALNPASAPAI